MNPFLNSLSAEDQLMIALCRLSSTAEHKKYISGLVEKVTQWKHFVSQANEHGVAALVCNNLKEQGLMEKVPDSQAAFLTNAYLKSFSRNTYLFEKLKEVKKYLAEINIEPILLKGMALELSVYGNMGLRQMNDIDLYIDREDCLRAWNHLISKGYKPQALKSPLYKKIILDIGKHLPELYSDGISIELHHKLFDTPPTSSAAFLPDEALAKEGYPLPHAPCSLLPVEVHFLYLIKHLVYHETQGESQLRLYNDLCQLMTQCSRDVKESGILDMAKEYGLAEQLSEKFYTLHLLWGMPLPDELFKSITAQKKQQIENKIRAFILKPKGHKVIKRGRTYRKTISNIPGTGRKLRYLIGDILPSISFLKTRYKINSSFLACIFYIIRLPKILLLILP